MYVFVGIPTWTDELQKENLTKSRNLSMNNRWVSHPQNEVVPRVCLSIHSIQRPRDKGKHFCLLGTQSYVRTRRKVPPPTLLCHAFTEVSQLFSEIYCMKSHTSKALDNPAMLSASFPTSLVIQPHLHCHYAKLFHLPKIYCLLTTLKYLTLTLIQLSGLNINIASSMKHLKIPFMGPAQ